MRIGCVQDTGISNEVVDVSESLGHNKWQSTVFVYEYSDRQDHNERNADTTAVTG